MYALQASLTACFVTLFETLLNHLNSKVFFSFVNSFLISVSFIICSIGIRKRVGNEEGNLRVNMIEGKRDDMEHVKVPEIRPEEEKKEQEDLQDVQTTIPIEQQEKQTNGEQITQTQAENELEDMFDAL